MVREEKMRIIQVSILAALVVIAGLLFSISQKMNTPAAPAPPAAIAAAVPDVPPQVQTPPPAPAAAKKPARKPSPVAAPKIAELPHSESIPQPPAQNAQAVSTVPAYAPPSPPPPPAVRTVTVQPGTAFTVRLLDALSTEKNRAGDTFQASLDEPLVADGVVVAPRGASVRGRVVQARESGRVAGLAEMSLEVDSIATVAGEMQIATDTTMRQAQSTKGKDAATVGAVAGIGAAIGAIAGGRKGAGIGAAAGGAAGTADVMGTRGKPVKFDPEARLTFRLKAPLTVTAENDRLQTTRQDPDRPILHRR